VLGSVKQYNHCVYAKSNMHVLVLSMQERGYDLYTVIRMHIFYIMSQILQDRLFNYYCILCKLLWDGICKL